MTFPDWGFCRRETAAIKEGWAGAGKGGGEKTELETVKVQDCRPTLEFWEHGEMGWGRGFHFKKGGNKADKPVLIWTVRL